MTTLKLSLKRPWWLPPIRIAAALLFGPRVLLGFKVADTELDDFAAWYINRLRVCAT